jgi:hypothetical protein
MLTGTIAMLLFGLQGATAAPATAAATPTAAERRAAESANLDQMICRASEPVLGSRVARRRICRTRAQWMAFEDDRAQLRRDIQNSGRGPNNE